MICQFNHQPCQYIECPLWDGELQRCLFHLAIFKVLERPETAPEEPPRLTKKQGDILELLAQGCTNEEIGKALAILPQTVKNHVSGLLRRLHAKNRAHAVAIAVRKGIISFESEAK